jgi:ribonuclease P/MRP protein subunit POP3
VLVGLNTITRQLELLSRCSRPAYLQPQPGVLQKRVEITRAGFQPDPANPVMPRHLAAVFVSRSSQPSALHAHLPRLISTASQAHPQLSPTRLVQLPKGSEDHISSSLQLPRAAFVGIIEGAPHSKPLIDFVFEHVPAINISWLEETCSAQYKPVNIKVVETTVPIKTRGRRTTSEAASKNRS